MANLVSLQNDYTCFTPSDYWQQEIGDYRHSVNVVRKAVQLSVVTVQVVHVYHVHCVLSCKLKKYLWQTFCQTRVPW